MKDLEVSGERCNCTPLQCFLPDLCHISGAHLIGRDGLVVFLRESIHQRSVLYQKDSMKV